MSTDRKLQEMGLILTIDSHCEFIREELFAQTFYREPQCRGKLCVHVNSEE